MKTVLLIAEFVVGALLIVCVLLHSPKGDGLGGMGGATQQFQAQRGLESGLDRVTTTLAILFLVVAAVLSLFVGPH